MLDKRRDRLKKEQVIYKLNLNGCKKFLELCESPQFSVYESFSKGAKLLKKEIAKVWFDDCNAKAAYV